MKRITEYDNITTVAESDVLPIVDVSDTEQASTGSTRKGSIEKIADYLKDRVETLTNKTLTSPDINTPDIDGGTIDGATINSGSIGSDTSVVEVLKKVYPVGCIYISSVSTSPATLFGFGTWTLVGEGKALFGVDSTDTDFDTAEETGGSKTVTLTAAQSGVPAHTHSVASSGNHTHTTGNQSADHTHTISLNNNTLVNRNVAGTGGAQGGDTVTASTITATAGNQSASHTHSISSSGAHTHTASNNTTASASEAHTNLPPYYTAYFYKRTA